MGWDGARKKPHLIEIARIKQARWNLSHLCLAILARPLVSMLIHPSSTLLTNNQVYSFMPR